MFEVRGFWNFEPRTSNFESHLSRLSRAAILREGLGAVVEGERPNRRVVTRTIDFDGEVGARG
jgi:hypothetical protein